MKDQAEEKEKRNHELRNEMKRSRVCRDIVSTAPVNMEMNNNVI